MIQIARAVLGRVSRAGRPLVAVVAVLCAHGAHAQLRVVAYNITGLAGDQASLKTVLASFHTDDTNGYAAPVGIFVFSEVHQSDVSALTTLVNQSAPAGVAYALATYTGSTSEDSASGAEAAYYRTDLLTEVPSAHVDISTGASRYTDRWLFTLNGYTSTAARIYVYGGHLKASSGSSNEALRLSGVQAIRANADALGAGVRAIYAGDMNFYTNAESGYTAFVAAGNGAAVDPLGTADWTGASMAWKHTQSPRDIVAGGLIGGGMDDRFDFLLPTTQLMDGMGLSYIANSYRAVGNDGNHYNLGINAGTNTYFPGNASRSATLANALFNSADHIPVMMDLEVPAWNTAVLGTVPARVIQGATVTAEVRVANDAPGNNAIGIDALAYTCAGSGVLSGSVSGAAAALTPSYTSVTLPISTATVGARTGTATVTSTSEAVQNPTISLPVSVQVLRASNPSFSTTSDTNTATVAFPGVTVGAAAVDATTPVANFGFTTDQSTMSITQVTVPSGPFSYVSGVASGIGSAAGQVRFRFNPAGLAPGTYTASATIRSSDESIPGATTAQITANLTATVGSGNAADLNGDGRVDGADLGLLLAAWGQSGAGDLNNDGTIDGADLGLLLSAWG